MISVEVEFGHDFPRAMLRLESKESDLISPSGEPIEVVTYGRHDPCVGIRATPIAEALMAIVIMDHALRHRAQCGEVVSGTPVIPVKQE